MTDKLDQVRKLCSDLGYDSHLPVDRETREQVFMRMAVEASKRSPDSQTQVGAVITTENHRILSTGYNGYPREIDYSLLPNTRPHKYPWFLHAERNALANCEVRPANGICYSTNAACNDCLMALWQHGVTTIYEGKNFTNARMTQNEEYFKIREIFLHLSGMKVIEVDLSYLS